MRFSEKVACDGVSYDGSSLVKGHGESLHGSSLVKGHGAMDNVDGTSLCMVKVAIVHNSKAMRIESMNDVRKWHGYFIEASTMNSNGFKAAYILHIYVIPCKLAFAYFAQLAIAGGF